MHKSDAKALGEVIWHTVRPAITSMLKGNQASLDHITRQQSVLSCAVTSLAAGNAGECRAWLCEFENNANEFFRKGRS